MYNEQIIRNEVKNKDGFCRFIFKDEVSSTNDELAYLARNGEKEVTVMLAESQTGGKGRMGRTFHSPKGNGIYMSILLRPSFLPDDCNLLTPMTAVAAVKAIEMLPSFSFNSLSFLKYSSNSLFFCKRSCSLSSNLFSNLSFFKFKNLTL